MTKLTALQDLRRSQVLFQLRALALVLGMAPLSPQRERRKRALIAASSASTETETEKDAAA